ncbi:MAG: WbuC family cupin fold metalloprotein [Bacteroidales bacterium]|nr:WbuC family cupin fold metalloprotein [Bacteroidales bacterium]
MKRLDFELFGEVESRAEASPRRRIHYDLRTEAFEPKDADGNPSWHDTSMKMLNVLMTDTVIPIHRHRDTNEVVIVMKGRGYEAMYDSKGQELERVMMEAGSECSGVVVPRAAWHTFVALEDGTTIFEAKDGAYDPVETEEFLTPSAR